jgi:hypothetical protein
MSLVVYGSLLGKTSERFVVKKEGKVIDEKPFFRVSEIVVPSRGVTVSGGAIFELSLPRFRGHLTKGGYRGKNGDPDEEARDLQSPAPHSVHDHKLNATILQPRGRAQAGDQGLVRAHPHRDHPLLADALVYQVLGHSPCLSIRQLLGLWRWQTTVPVCFNAQLANLRVVDQDVHDLIEQVERVPRQLR